MIGKIEQYLLDQIKEKGTIHFTLVDPDKSSGYDCAKIAAEAEKGGTTGIMVGGSTLASSTDLDDAVKRIKKAVKIASFYSQTDPWVSASTLTRSGSCHF